MRRLPHGQVRANPKRCVTNLARMTDLIAPSEDGIAEAVRILRAGGLVAMPTETVCNGLAGDARNDRAVAGISKRKGDRVSIR